ncbi:hypothetical protein LOZ58_002761 [Ophidiomyces ophidiicola]|nr:hypothetical protein LOZ66_001781 [Ophidiomyces ophidiicola]KAI1962419.1 hypothetical protein LOZ58_002761 [Ophidiomyces ophidiicola]
MSIQKWNQRNRAAAVAADRVEHRGSAGAGLHIVVAVHMVVVAVAVDHKVVAVAVAVADHKAPVIDHMVAVDSLVGIGVADNLESDQADPGTEYLAGVLEEQQGGRTGLDTEAEAAADDPLSDKEVDLRSDAAVRDTVGQMEHS